MNLKWKHSGRLDSAPTQLENRHRELARKAAAESIVLLKNDDLLPLDLSEPVALFGSGAGRTVKGGIGSGDVNNRETISIYRGFCEAGATVTSTSWIEDYEEKYRNARELWKEKVLERVNYVENAFDAYAENPFVFPEGRTICEEDVRKAVAAVYVISRISGEGKDRRLEKGDYYLSDKEKSDILYLAEQEIPTVLLINSGGPVELTDILEEAENIRAVLNISQPGQEVGYAVADVLFGQTVPSGKLTSTWAKRYSDYPCSDSYSYLDGNLDKEEYREGIYVGYRYFDSFEKETLFPFGYGISYTEFKIQFKDISVAERRIYVDVTVENSGSTYAGKEVVQVYVTLPQNGTEREYRRLAGFKKTESLMPGESGAISVSIDQKQLAVFSEERQAWVIEAGTYGIWTGNSSADARLVAFLIIQEETVLEHTEKICPLDLSFEKLNPPADLTAREKEWRRKGENAHVAEYVFVPHQEIRRKCSRVTADERYRTEELIPLLYGNVTEGASTLGSAGIRVPGSAGETSECLEEKYGLRSMIMADGPAGLRLRQCYQVDRATDTVYGTGVLGSLENGFLEPMKHHEDADTYYQFCTAFPVGTALAQTWNTELVEKFGRAIGEEMREFGISLWLAPGMNIQRNPLCGRNFEYYSEDPLLAGTIASAVTRGVQRIPGCAVTIKHFACNNQEDNRMGVDSQVSEKALREIYLRGFEIVVKESAPHAIMTSYNLVNGIHSANSYELCTTVARNEWGFDGVIMSDWNTTVPRDGSVAWKCADAGNDIIMPGNKNDDRSIREAYAEGKLTEEKIRECAGRIIALAEKLNKTELSYEGYELVWEDRFEDDSLNRDDWNVELHEPGWVNNELQKYVDEDENIFIQDGHLVLKAVEIKNPDGRITYTSGRVNTQNKHNFTYGIFEARIKVPEGKGFLPAFWMMPAEEEYYGQWPKCGEIDIMEVLGHKTDTTYGTIHYGVPHRQSQGRYQLSEGSFSDEYHVFSVEWKPGILKWYVDGNLIFTEKEWYSMRETGESAVYPAPFDQPFYLILNLAVGGNWPGNPNEETDFEKAALVVDYVKVYQKKK